MNRIKLLMGYNSSKTLTENTKNILSEKVEGYPTSPIYTEDQIAQVYQNNSIKAPNGSRVYADANIVINQIIDNKIKNTDWTNQFTDRNGNLWSDEKLKNFLNIPSVWSFTNSNGDLMKGSFRRPGNPQPNEKYDGWKFEGYNVFNEKGTGDKNVLYNPKQPLRLYDWRLDDPTSNAEVEVIPPAGKSTYLKTGMELKWTIINKSKTRLLKIEQVELQPVGKQTDDRNLWNCFDFPQCSQNIINVKEFTKDNIKPGWNGYVNLTVQIPFEDDGTKAKSMDFYVVITTSEGKIYSQYRTGSNNMESRDEQNIRLVKELTSKRLTPNKEFKVPKGFSPFCYEDFIKELHDIIDDPNDTSCRNSDIWNKFFKNDNNITSIYRKPPEGSDVVNTAAKIFTGTLDISVSKSCQKRIEDLLKKYYDEKFPTGICPQQKEIFDKKIKDIETQIKEFENSHQSWIEGGSGSMEDGGGSRTWGFSYLNLSKSDKKIYDTLTSQRKELETNYGFDDRSAIKRFVDEDLIWVQLGIAALATLASLGAASPLLAGSIGAVIGVEAAAVAGTLNTVARLGTFADFLMNAAAGTYQIAHGDTKEGLLSFFFAALPAVHKVYGKVGRLFSDGEMAATKTLANKLGQLGENVLKTSDDVEAFIATKLTKQESTIFRKALSMSESDLQGAIKTAQELVESKLPSTALKIAKGVGKLAVTVATDFAVIKTMGELHDQAVNFINKYCKNCIETEEEKRKAKTYLDNLSPDQQNSIKLLFSRIVKSENIPNETKAKMMSDIIQGKKPLLVQKLTANIEKKSPQEVKKVLDKTLQDILKEYGIELNTSNNTVTPTNVDNNIYYLGPTGKDKKIIVSKEDFLKMYTDDTLTQGVWSYNGNDEEIHGMFEDIERFSDIPDVNPEEDLIKTKN